MATLFMVTKEWVNSCWWGWQNKNRSREMHSLTQQNTRNNETQRRKRLCVIVPRVLSYRSGRFPTPVPFMVTRMPQQVTQATNSLTAACSNRSLILCSEPPETPDTIMFTRGFSSGTSRCCNGQVNNNKLSLCDKTQVCSCTKENCTYIRSQSVSYLIHKSSTFSEQMGREITWHIAMCILFLFHSHQYGLGYFTIFEDILPHCCCCCWWWWCCCCR